jgi:hypothetical protein
MSKSIISGPDIMQSWRGHQSLHGRKAKYQTQKASGAQHIEALSHLGIRYAPNQTKTDHCRKQHCLHAVAVCEGSKVENN